jgi:aconitate hydratase
MPITRTRDRFGARATFDTGSGVAYYYRLNRLEEAGIANIAHLPFSIKVLLEAVLREANGYEVTEDDVVNLANWDPKQTGDREVPFKPARVILQDFTAWPAWWTWRRCVTPCTNWAAIPGRSSR